MSDTPIVITEDISNISVPEVVEVVRVIERGEQGPQGIPGTGGSGSNLSTGALFPGPDLTFNTDTTVTISENDFNLYSTSDHSGDLVTYTIAEATLGPVPPSTPYYIVADYTLGVPVYRATLNVDEVNESDIAPVFTLGLDDQGILNIEDWDTLADGKVDMGHLHQVKHQRFSSWDGLVPSVDGALHFLLTSGRMFLGWVPHTLGAFNSANAVLTPDDSQTMCYEYSKDNLGAWASTLIQEYDNDNYNPAGGVTSLGLNKYVVLWWFRSLDTVTGGARMAYVRSENQYNTPAEALAASIRSDLPTLFPVIGALVAKTVVQKGAVLADVRNLLDKSIPATPVTDHNDLADRSALGAHPAASISAVTTSWDGILLGVGGVVQDALDELDNLNPFTLTDEAKLDGIETNATTDQTDVEIKTAYENNLDTNAFTDTEQTKLSGIEPNSTTDQTDVEIKTSYENNINTNAFTDAEQTKLSGIEDGATTDQTDLEIKTAYENNADTNEFTDAEKVIVGNTTNTNSGDQTATTTSVDTTNFDGNLSAADDTVLKALETIDDLVLGGGTGDMTKLVYDPNTIEGDAFDMENMVEGVTSKIFTATERTKLTGIEDSATTDQTDLEIKTAYENNADTNAFTDAEKVIVGNTSNTNSGDQTAATLSVDTTAFNNNLSALDDTAQKALETIDDLALGSGGGTTEKIYNQVAHGFTVLLTPVYLVAGVWTAARADDLTKLSLGLITEIPDTDNIKVAVSGFYNIEVHGLTVDQFYYLADTGGLTATEPDISQPVLYVVDADNVIVLPYRPEDITGIGIAEGGMLAATYDPTTVEGDAFDMDNMVEGTTTKILTNTERSEIAANTAKVSNIDYPSDTLVAQDITDIGNLSGINSGDQNVHNSLTGIDGSGNYHGTQDALGGLEAGQSISSSNPVMTENVGIIDFTASRSSLLSDRDKLISNQGSSDFTYTLENTMPVGFGGELWEESTGTITYVAGSGITIIAKDSNLKTNGIGAASTFRKVRAGVYYVAGDLTT